MPAIIMVTQLLARGMSTYNSVTYVRGALCKITDYPAIVYPCRRRYISRRRAIVRRLPRQSSNVSPAPCPVPLPSTSAANVAMGLSLINPLPWRRRVARANHIRRRSVVATDTHYGEPRRSFRSGYPHL